MYTCKKKKTTYFLLGMFVFSVSFYVLFAVMDGPFLSPDSITYIKMSLHREPLYSLFLAFFRLCFGPDDKTWLQWAVLGQSLLAAAAAWSIPAFLYLRLSLSRLTATALLFFPLAVSLLCRFGAGRRAMYSNGIESEAVALPLFLLFIRYLAEYLMNRMKPHTAFYQEKSFWAACILSVLLISARRQMLCTLILLVLVLLAEGLRGKSVKRSLLRVLASVLIILSLVSAVDRTYNYMLRGKNMTHSGGSRFLLTMVFYTADRNDAADIRDPNIRELFLDIYDVCDSAGWLKHSAGQGWLNRVTHFGDHYDHIQVDTLRPAVTEYLQNLYPGEDTFQAAESDRIMHVMTFALLPSCLPSILGSFFDNLLSGLITTIAMRTPVLIGFSALLYAAWLSLFLLLIRKKGRPEILLFSGLTLVSIVINVCLVSAVIFCQSRYTIYNMPLFYMSFFLMLCEARRKLPLRSNAQGSRPVASNDTAPKKPRAMKASK